MGILEDEIRIGKEVAKCEAEEQRISHTFRVVLEMEYAESPMRIINVKLVQEDD